MARTSPVAVVVTVAKGWLCYLTKATTFVPYIDSQIGLSMTQALIP
jgi:hypothetical protein